jgi:glyoxylase-like metal-dependent hydrolase (beta-lactamase superfamily II)
MAQPPSFTAPSSSTTVKVRIIDTTSTIRGIPTAPFITPQIKGFTTLNCPAYSFLIEHPSNRKLLFDLGVRKDISNLSPKTYKRITSGGWDVTVKSSVREQLEANGVEGKSIEGIIWSHWHWDHTGDPSTFDSTTALIVGPGFKENFTPGYPANPEGVIRESDYEGRELREIEFNQGIRIGRFNAFDYFGDGSFFLLDSPGHAIGHMCGLARVSANPDSFIFMGGDACHHGGEFRPSEWLPLPSSISPNPLDLKSKTPCPGSLFHDILRDGDNEKPFFVIPEGGIANDVKEAQETVDKVMEADAHAEVFVVMAHDVTLLDVVDFFPEYANGFREKGWVEEGRWLFLKDFEEAVKH